MFQFKTQHAVLPISQDQHSPSSLVKNQMHRQTSTTLSLPKSTTHLRSPIECIKTRTTSATQCVNGSCGALSTSNEYWHSAPKLDLPVTHQPLARYSKHIRRLSTQLARKHSGSASRNARARRCRKASTTSLPMIEPSRISFDSMVCSAREMASALWSSKR
jgi:hypothetical protein